MSLPFSDVYVGGIGETEKSRAQEARGESFHNVEEYFAKAARLTLDDADMEKSDVDGLGVVLPLATSTPIIYSNVLAETLGFTGLNWLVVSDHGGAGALELLIQGSMAVQSGVVENLLCIGADTPLHPGDDETAVIPRSSRGFDQAYMDPLGAQGPSAQIAMVQRRHMDQYGTTLRELGTIPVTQRHHASLNPLAYLRDPIDFEAYRDSPPVSDPVRLLDCVIPVNGGAGFLLRHRRSESTSPNPPVYMRGFGQCLGNFQPANDYDITRTGVQRAGREAFEQASVDRDDIDTFHLYDDYPIIVLMQIEDLGYCEKGEGGRFVRSRSLRYDGRFPLNTSGGQLSAGQAGGSGGYVQLLEGIRQLRGSAGERQVAGCRLSLVTGVGGLSYERNLQNTDVVILSNRGVDR